MYEITTMNEIGVISLTFRELRMYLYKKKCYKISWDLDKFEHPSRLHFQKEEKTLCSPDFSIIINAGKSCQGLLQLCTRDGKFAIKLVQNFS